MQLVSTKIVSEAHECVLEFKICDQEWNELVKRSFTSFSQNVKLPGFRPGKAPKELIAKNINESDVLRHAAEKQIKSFFNDENFWANKDYKETVDKVIDSFPHINIIKLDNNELSFKATFQLRPEIELPDLKKLDLNCEKVKVTNEEVQAQLRQYIANDIILEPKHEQVVSDGDSANINFVGKLDGVEFENGSANDYELIIGSKSFIDNFEQQLIGMKAQETKDINVTFPQQYQEPSLAGKPVTFTVTVNKVSIPKLPEMSEEYLKKFNIDVKDEKEFSKYIENQLYEAKQYQQFTDLKQQITKQIMALSKINYIPEHLLIQEKNRLHDQLTQEASKQNQSLLEHVQQQGYETLDAYDKYEQIMAENNLVFAFAIDKIIQELDIKIDESDLNDYFAKAAKVYNIAPDKIRDVFADHMNSIESFVLHEKVMKTIAEYYV